MKIQCDVCSKESASVFCPSDEAALCGGCDRRVHHANKLAGKHSRFSLIRPSSSKESSPKCDICQDKRAFLFCQEDRAILCSECDFTIHRSNEHTQKHNRFLLTGVKISTSNSSQPCNPSSSSSSQDHYFMAGECQQYDNGEFYTSHQMMYDKDVQFFGEDVNHHYQNLFFH